MKPRQAHSGDTAIDGPSCHLISADAFGTEVEVEGGAGCSRGGSISPSRDACVRGADVGEPLDRVADGDLLGLTEVVLLF